MKQFKVKDLKNTISESKCLNCLFQYYLEPWWRGLHHDVREELLVGRIATNHLANCFNSLKY